MTNSPSPKDKADQGQSKAPEKDVPDAAAQLTEEAALAAQISAEHAAHAANQAEADELAAREAAEREAAEQAGAQLAARMAAEKTAADAAEAAEQAARDAEAADLEARELAKEDPKAKLCPNCRTEMVKHGPENPFKAGCWHCNGCGACWQPGLKRQRAGHTGPAVPA